MIKIPYPNSKPLEPSFVIAVLRDKGYGEELSRAMVNKWQAEILVGAATAEEIAQEVAKHMDLDFFTVTNPGTVANVVYPLFGGSKK